MGRRRSTPWLLLGAGAAGMLCLARCLFLPPLILIGRFTSLPLRGPVTRSVLCSEASVKGMPPTLACRVAAFLHRRSPEMGVPDTSVDGVTIWSAPADDASPRHDCAYTYTCGGEGLEIAVVNPKSDGPLAQDGEVTVDYHGPSGLQERDWFNQAVLERIWLQGPPSALDLPWIGPEFTRDAGKSNTSAQYLRSQETPSGERRAADLEGNARLARAARERTAARLAALRACLGRSGLPLESCGDS